MNSWLIVDIGVLLMSIILAGVMIPQILLISFRKKLFDEPDERKIHKGAVPRLGGIAFMPVVFFTLGLVNGVASIVFPLDLNAYSWPLARPLSFCFCCLLMLWVVGIADDLIGVKYRAKFVVQIACGVLLICGGLWFDNLHGALGIGWLPEWAGWPLTVLLAVFIINSINLIDGIDGLASGLCSIALLIYGIVFLLSGMYVRSAIAFATLGVLIPFFYYNVFGNVEKHKKIFMGDTGSLTVGMMITFLVICLLQNRDGVASYDVNMTVVAFSPLIVPCFDVVRVYFVRVKNGKSPFLPDKNHIHHKLLQRGWSQHRALIAIVCFSLALSVANIVASCFLNVNVIIVGDIAVWFACIYALRIKAGKQA